MAAGACDKHAKLACGYTIAHMDLLEDVIRVRAFVEQEGTQPQQWWLLRLSEAFHRANAHGNPEMCSDLHLLLVSWEQAELHHRGSINTLMEQLSEAPARTRAAASLANAL